MPLILKCKKCRKPLTDGSTDVFNGHNKAADLENIHSKDPTDNKSCEEESFSAFYLPEENYPKWVSASISSVGWVSGKLKCPSCSVTVGSADFVAGRKCSCGTNVLLPVKILKSKVDTSWKEGPS